MLALSADLLHRFHATVPRPQPPADDDGETPDAGLEAVADALLADAPAVGPLFVFAYGSLLWKPAFPPDFEARAVAPGWHRAFRLTLTDWRGTPDNPGLMMVLDRGGTCHGMAMAVPESGRRATVLSLLHREMDSRFTSNQPRWISVRVDGRTASAIAFCADRSAPEYAGALPEALVVERLSRAVGHVGSCAEYLQKTILALSDRGIRDGNLWRLQALVADRIEADLRTARRS